MNKSVKITLISVVVVLVSIIGFCLHGIFYPARSTDSQRPQISTEQIGAEPQLMPPGISQGAVSKPVVRAKTRIITNSYYIPKKKKRGKVVPKKYLSEFEQPENPNPEEMAEEDDAFFEMAGEVFKETEESSEETTEQLSSEK